MERPTPTTPNNRYATAFGGLRLNTAKRCASVPVLRIDRETSKRGSSPMPLHDKSMTTKVGYSCGVLFGGNANNGANCGFAYANSNNVPANANANIGSRNCLRGVSSPGHAVDFGVTASPLGEKFNKHVTEAGRNALCIGYRRPQV